MKKLIFLTILIVAGCHDDSSLGGNYFFLSKYESQDVGYKYGAIVYKSKQKYVYGKTIIYDHVDLVKTNDNYITVLQHPNRNMMKVFLIDKIKYGEKGLINNLYINLPHGKEPIKKLTEKSIDSLLINEPYYQMLFANDVNYWIIEIANDSLIGPLTNIEFEQIRKEMKISDELKLN